MQILVLPEYHRYTLPPLLEFPNKFHYLMESAVRCHDYELQLLCALDVEWVMELVVFPRLDFSALAFVSMVSTIKFSLSMGSLMQRLRQMTLALLVRRGAHEFLVSLSQLAVH